MSIHFFDDNAQQLARFMRSANPEGRIEVGYMQIGSPLLQITGIFIQNWIFAVFPLTISDSPRLAVLTVRELRMERCCGQHTRADRFGPDYP